MNFKFIKLSFLTFLTTYLFICLFLSAFIYKILIEDFVELENEQNLKNINSVLNHMNTRIKNIKSIVVDYSKWDDTYNFIKTENQEYIYENFRKGTSTLEELNIDFIIFANSNNKTLFSRFLEKSDSLSNNIEQSIIEKFKDYKKVSTLFKYKENLLYLVKEDVQRSDFTGESNGYIISGKYINQNSLSSISKVYESLKISSLHYYANTDLQLNLIGNNLVTVRYLLKNDEILNFIQFFDIDKKYIFTLKAKNPQVIIKKGEKTILILTLVLSLVLFILMFILYRNQKIVERYNVLLEEKVNRRTNQLQKSLKSLKDKNRKLKVLSNTDSLTNIKNRRSFFIESKKALDLAIEEKRDFNILLMDIDYFKSINDTYGHALGDEVLKKFTQIVESIIDDKAVFGRLGGEEFCIAFSNIHFAEVSKTAEKIRKEIENTVLKIDDKEIKFTISLGLANKKEYKFIDEILVVADEYLYKAKNEGRNRLVRENIRQKKRVL